jgi:DNA/RNA endonuclease YhcR with UshA esterase domain
MKKILPGVLIVLTLVTVVSCSSMKSTTNTAKTLNVYGAGVIQKPVIVELDVKQIKVTATINGKLGSNIEALKGEAVSVAVKNAAADVLVEPTYTIVSNRGTSTVTVTGFPATYKNFRDIKIEDIPLIKAGILQTAKVAEPTTISQKRN